ncbi:hypothetical protein [Sphingomonas mucosissima]|uniref:hypothetical protein n=1 Tax=Sphingomonas mucosissima TaxID=370959 RepID=UPI001FE94E8E|nr:hypothetical protein [Sphingomonas mucosissima]
MSFIFSGASQNAKLKRPNPPMVTYLGYVLVGVTAGVSLLLFAHAIGLSIGQPLIALTL